MLLQVQLLSLLGGDTVQRIVYLQMNKMLTNEVATKYSGQGKKKKLPFIKLKIYDAVLGTVRVFNACHIFDSNYFSIVATRNRCPEATEEEIKKKIGLFLATASSRLKQVSNETEGNGGNNDDENYGENDM